MLIDVLVELRHAEDRRDERQCKGSIEAYRGSIDLTVAKFCVDSEVVSGVPDEAASHAPVLEIIDVRFAQKRIAVVAIGIPQIGIDREGHRVIDRSADIACDEIRRVLAEACLDLAAEFLTRIAGRDDDGARCGVTAVKRALRAFQDFDLLKVGIFAVQRCRISHQNAIDDQCKAVLGIPCAVDAAYIDLRIGDFGRIDDGDARRQVDEILGALDTRSFDLVPGEHGNGGGDVFQRLCALPCGDNDFLDGEIVLRDDRLRGSQPRDERDGDTLSDAVSGVTVLRGQCHDR